MTLLDLKEGDLLIAPPKMQDPRFQKTVILLTQVQQENVLGFCLNRQTDHYLSKFIPEVTEQMNLDPQMFWGGPVSPQTIWLLHESTWCQKDKTVNIDKHWAMTSHRSMFNHVGSESWPYQHRLMFGFCGWAPEQLKGEIEGTAPWSKSSSWLLWRDPDSSLLLEVDPEDLWAACTEQSASQAINDWL